MAQNIKDNRIPEISIQKAGTQIVDTTEIPASLKIKRARDGDRTRDPLLGKEVLHH